MPIQRPGHGEVENGLQNADHFGALQHLGDLALPVDQLGGAADRRAVVDLDPVEMHTGVLLHQIDRLLRLYPHTRCVGRHQELAHAVVGPRHHEQEAALRAGLHAVFDTVDAVAGIGRRRGDRRLMRCPALPGFVHRPRRDGLTGDQRLDRRRVRLRVGGIHQPGKHRADRIQRTGSHRLAELFGDHRQISHAVTRDAAAAEFLGDQQRRPPQLGGSLPPVRLEGDTLSVQLPHPAQRNLFLQKCLGGGGEEYLFGGIDGSHDVG